MNALLSAMPHPITICSFVMNFATPDQEKLAALPGLKTSEPGSAACSYLSGNAQFFMEQKAVNGYCMAENIAHQNVARRSNDNKQGRKFEHLPSQTKRHIACKQTQSNIHKSV